MLSCGLFLLFTFCLAKRVRGMLKIGGSFPFRHEIRPSPLITQLSFVMRTHRKNKDVPGIPPMNLELKQKQFNAVMALYEGKKRYVLIGRFVSLANITLQLYTLF